MTTEKMLARLRRKLNDVDPATASFTSEALLAAIDDVRQELVVRRVNGMDAYSVDTDPDSVTWGISPELSDEDAMLLLYGAAVELLEATFRGRVNRGELGVVWKSGLEEESTATATRAYQDMIKELENEFNQLLLIRNRATFATRSQ